MPHAQENKTQLGHVGLATPFKLDFLECALPPAQTAHAGRSLCQVFPWSDARESANEFPINCAWSFLGALEGAELTEV